MSFDKHIFMRGRERIEELSEPEIQGMVVIDLFKQAAMAANDMSPEWFAALKPGLYAPRSTEPFLEFGDHLVFLSEPNVVVSMENFVAMSPVCPILNTRTNKVYRPGSLRVGQNGYRLLGGYGYEEMLVQIARSLFAVLVKFATEIGVVYHNQTVTDGGQWLRGPEDHPEWPRLLELRAITQQLCHSLDGWDSVRISQHEAEREALEARVEQESTVLFNTAFMQSMLNDVRSIVKNDLWHEYKFYLRGSGMVIEKYGDIRIRQWEALALAVNQGRVQIQEVEHSYED